MNAADRLYFVGHEAADRIDELEATLRTVGAHWPGEMTGYCMGCDDVRWPCDTVLDAVRPWMPDDVETR